MSVKVEVQRRQAILTIMACRIDEFGLSSQCESDRVPVLVWPMPTGEGLLVVEHQDGTAERVLPESLTFLDSKELFDQYDWSML